MINIKTLIFIFYIVFINYSVLSDEADKVTTTSSDFETTYNEDEIFDPIEPFNRVIFGFNNIADKIILEPAAKGYHANGSRSGAEGQADGAFAAPPKDRSQDIE